MNAEQQQRLRDLAVIMLRDAHGEDFTEEQAALFPAQQEEYRRLTEPQEILSLLDALKRSYTAFESMSYLAASHAERAHKLLAESFIPGQMHCAKCKFQLTKRVSCMGSGTIGAGDNKTEPCPNGCGPLWPVTWKQADQENQESIDRLCDEQRELRAQVDRLCAELDASRKQLREASPLWNAPLSGHEHRCLACGEYHSGLRGLPCPKMTPKAGGNPDA